MSDATPPADVSAKPPRRFRWLRIAMSLFFGVLALALCLAVNTWREAAWTADQSAQAALDKEISDQLAAVPLGQSYPDSLSELVLTYPDGGDSSLLARFEYHSSGQSCTVRTVLWRKEVVRTFPATE